jgi:hemerythrin
MTLLQWKPAYSLGIPSVDHEHRELISLINDTYRHIEGSADPAAIESCLEDIYSGIAAHFALEERHMREAGYAEYAAHKDEHEDLLDQIRELMDDFATNPESGQAALRQRLADWFGAHFATFDARLHHVMEGHQQQ